jgi:hypothetical protein
VGPLQAIVHRGERAVHGRFEGGQISRRLQIRQRLLCPQTRRAPPWQASARVFVTDRQTEGRRGPAWVAHVPVHPSTSPTPHLSLSVSVWGGGMGGGCGV